MSYTVNGRNSLKLTCREQFLTFTTSCFCRGGGASRPLMLDLHRTLTPTSSDSTTTVRIFPIVTRSRGAMASQADAVCGRARSYGQPAVPRLCAAERGCVLGGFRVQIFLRHRRTAVRAQAEGAEDMSCLSQGLTLVKLCQQEYSGIFPCAQALPPPAFAPLRVSVAAQLRCAAGSHG